MSLSSKQRFFLAILPRSIGKAMEKESRLWMMHCPSCNYERSIWDWGGIRYLAAGRPRRLRHCSHCGQWTWHQVYKRA
jgi:hypothetical protein